jgi:poly(A) polymerase
VPVSVHEITAATAAELQAGERAWLVGGAVRDALLHRLSPDADLAVDGDCERLAQTLGQRLGGPVFAFSERFLTWRVVLDEGNLDLAPLRGPDLAADLASRDFTVDAMARPVEGGGLVDLLGGRDDLQAGRLRICSPTALTEDPLRVLRLARLALQFDLEPDAAAVAAAVAAAGGLSSVSGERVEHELSTLLSLPNASSAVRRLSELGALAVVLPELDHCRGVLQNDYHHLDVFEHTLEALDHLPGIVEILGGESFLADPDDAGLPGAPPRVPLAWAVLLHDIAKPDVAAKTDDGRIMFWRHDGLGAEMAVTAAKRLRTSRRFQEYLARLVGEHLRLGFLVRELPLSRRALVRYRHAVEPFVFEAIALSLADRMATRGDLNPPRSLARHFRIARDVFGDPPPEVPDRLLDGEQVMELLGLDPGPEVGAALAALQEEVEVGEVTDPEAARAFTLSWWRDRRAAGEGEGEA